MILNALTNNEINQFNKIKPKREMKITLGVYIFTTGLYFASEGVSPTTYRQISGTVLYSYAIS